MSAPLLKQVNECAHSNFKKLPLRLFGFPHRFSKKKDQRKNIHWTHLKRHFGFSTLHLSGLHKSLVQVQILPAPKPRSLPATRGGCDAILTSVGGSASYVRHPVTGVPGWGMRRDLPRKVRFAGAVSDLFSYTLAQTLPHCRSFIAHSSCTTSCGAIGSPGIGFGPFRTSLGTF
jgi:hypothetical protein